LFQIGLLSFEFVLDRSFKFLRFQRGPLSFEFVSYRSLTEVDRKDQSKTNSKLKEPIWNLKNLNDLSETNSKLKGPNWNLINLKDLFKTNIKLKEPRNVFGLFDMIVSLFVSTHGQKEFYKIFDTITHLIYKLDRKLNKWNLWVIVRLIQLVESPS